jgi:hypothetical protein
LKTTTYFSDNFADGTLNAWTTTSGSIVTSPVYSSLYACKMDATDNLVIKDFSSVGTCYVRSYFYITDYPDVGELIDVGALFDSADGAWAGVCRLANVGGVITWNLSYHDSGWGLQNVDSGVTPDLNKWYHIQVKFVKNTVGGVILYVDELAVATGTGTSFNGNVDRIRFSGNSTTSYVFDDVVVADSYIEPIVSPSGNGGLMVLGGGLRLG